MTLSRKSVDKFRENDNTHFIAKGSIWLIAILSLLLYSSCGQNHGRHAETDRMNDKAYAFRYRNIDSTVTYGKRAMQTAGNDYTTGRAEALNHLAFADIKRLKFNQARRMLDTAIAITDNQIELLTAYVQKMRIDRLTSENRGFYANREKADACLRRINEEKDMLTDRQQRRRIFAESEYHIVCAEYYVMLGQTERAQKQLQNINPYGEIRQDTAQYLNYQCMTNAMSVNIGNDLPGVNGHFSELVSVLATARDKGYIYSAASAMLELGAYVINTSRLQYLKTANSAGMTYINPNDVADEYLAGWLTESAMLNFEEYGDVCCTVQANRQLALCCHELGEYDAAIDYLDKAVEHDSIATVPALMADIHELFSVAFSAIDDKQQSDWHRNLFLDLRELTRQDRFYESRAEQLDTISAQQNIMIIMVMVAILMLVFLLYFFNHLSKRAEKNGGFKSVMNPFNAWKEASDKEKAELLQVQEETEERLAEIRLRIIKGEEDNLEARAKMQMVNGIMPLICRMSHEVRMLEERDEPEAQRDARYEYITELAEEINRSNDTLTQWIELRQGQLRLHIGTFAIQPLFDIIEKSKSSFAIKGITLVVKYTESIVKADKVLTLFMLNTLADNARKFTPHGGTITINSTETDKYVEISVSDTGCGLTEEQKKTIFTRQISSGHGFGLLNCRGIIQKYHKVSKLFEPCMLGVESRAGEGSRFFFRLPQGIVRMVLTLLAGGASICAMADDDMQAARQFADSAYYSNIAGTYERTLMFSDSCRKYLNRHYWHTAGKKSKQMMRDDDGSAVAPEIQWLRDSMATDFSVILDIRNETAVAALALHEWKLYRYNNQIYTQLFQELSEDNTIGEYCRTVERQQTNKTITIIILTVVLIMIIPAYYFLFYRKRMLIKREAERLKVTEIEKIKETENAGKMHIRHHTEILADECEMAEQELAALHISNSVLDNCLSTIKHETMYYPSRIIQIVANRTDDNTVKSLHEIIDYYRDIYSMLSSQAQSQMERNFLHIRHMPLCEVLPDATCGIYITADRVMMDYLFRLLKRQMRGELSAPEITVSGQFNVVITFKGQFHNKIDYMMCRQILREHGEATSNRACGLSCHDGLIVVTLKGKKVNNTINHIQS